MKRLLNSVLAGSFCLTLILATGSTSQSAPPKDYKDSIFYRFDQNRWADYLRRYDFAIGSKVVQYAKSKVGQKVGNGECWTLVHDALVYAKAKEIPGQGGIAVYDFGTPVKVSAVKSGDILQFWNVKFVAPNGSWSSATQHTVIVSSVKGTELTVYEQNSPKGGAVRTNVYNTANLKEGRIDAFRPEFTK